MSGGGKQAGTGKKKAGSGEGKKRVVRKPASQPVSKILFLTTNLVELFCFEPHPLGDLGLSVSIQHVSRIAPLILNVLLARSKAAALYLDLQPGPT